MRAIFKKIFFLILLLLIINLTANSYSSDNRIRIAIFDFAVTNSYRPYGAIFPEYIRKGLSKNKIFDIVTKTEMEKALQKDEDGRLICFDTQCIIKTGEELNADKSIAGSISKVTVKYSEKRINEYIVKSLEKDIYTIRISIINLENGKEEHTIKEEFENPAQFKTASDKSIRKITSYLPKNIIVNEKPAKDPEFSSVFFSVNCGIYEPLGRYNDLLKTGLGSGISFEFREYLIWKYIPEIQIQYIYYKSKNDGDIDNVTMGLFQVLPGVSYRQRLNKVAPRISDIFIYGKINDGITRLDFKSDNRKERVEYLNTMGVALGAQYHAYNYINIGLEFGYQIISSRRTPIQSGLLGIKSEFRF